MKKLFMLFLVTVFVLSCISAFAASTGDFIKGENLKNPLMVAPYIAKTFKLNEKEGQDKKDSTAVRVKLERKSNIGNLSEGEYTVSAGLEF